MMVTAYLLQLLILSYDLSRVRPAIGTSPPLAHLPHTNYLLPRRSRPGTLVDVRALMVSLSTLIVDPLRWKAGRSPTCSNRDVMKGFCGWADIHGGRLQEYDEIFLPPRGVDFQAAKEYLRF